MENEKMFKENHSEENKEELQIKGKIRVIGDVWQDYIVRYNIFRSLIRLNEDVFESHYLGDILFYFDDTLDVIFQMHESKNSNEDFSFKIGFLQSIYIQQDFIEELLYIFRCKIEKGDLKQDGSYTINREIRNELVGHPIRKTKCKEDNITSVKQTLLSSVIYSKQQNPFEINYARYHRDNNYNLDVISHKISDIVDRHILFLNTYLDIIIEKLKEVLGKYLLEIENVQYVVNEKDFLTALKLVSLFFESFFEEDYVYEKDYITEIYEKKNTHRRYKVTVEKFYQELKEHLDETTENIKEFTNPPKDVKNDYSAPSDIIIKFVDHSLTNDNERKQDQKKNYHYELGKLANKRNLRDFDFFSKSLINDFKDNEVLIQELEYMRNNIDNKIEYYCSLNLIENIIGK